MIKFCPYDGTLLKLKIVKTSEGSFPALACEKCGYYIKHDITDLKITKKATTQESIRVIDEGEEVKTMPTIEVECPKCGNNRAYWWLLQTRSGDEPPTQFYRCTKCEYTWRQYA